MSFFALSEVKSTSTTTSTFCPEKILEKVLSAFELSSFGKLSMCIQWWYLLFAFLSFLLTRLSLCLLTHSCESLSLLFHRVFISIMTLIIAVGQKLKKTWAKTERRQNASQVCTFCSSFGKASWLATWAKTNIYYKNKSSPLNICKYFQGKYS